MILLFLLLVLLWMFGLLCWSSSSCLRGGGEDHEQELAKSLFKYLAIFLKVQRFFSAHVHYCLLSFWRGEKRDKSRLGKEKEEGEGQRDRLSQIVGIFVGILSFVWEFSREFGRCCQIPKIPNFFEEFHKSRWGFRQSLMMNQEMMKKLITSPQKKITKSIASSIHEGLEISKNMIRSPNRSRY